MTARCDPARAQGARRERLLRLERQEKARADARAVAEGVAETVALSRARGQAFEQPARRSPRAKPYRKQGGLEWLARKGRITPRQAQAGERYGQAYRRVRLDPSIRSTLDVKPGGASTAGPTLAEVVAHGEGTEAARVRLAAYRRRLMGQADLIAACDLICGEEKTPREAGGSDREGARLEAVLKVALDLLAGG